MKIKAIFALSLALTAFGIAGGESLQKPAVLRSIGMHPVERLSTAMPPSPFSIPPFFSTATEQLFIPSAARVLGAHGTDWRTDMMLFNPGSATVNYTIYYTPGGMDGTQTPYNFSSSLDAHKAPFHTNIVENLFHLTNSAGSIRIISDGPLMAASRTYNQAVEGTYGQFIPGRSLEDSTSASSGPGQIIGINQNDDYRTNIGFAETAGQVTGVQMIFYDSTGTQLHAASVMIEPYGWLQSNLADIGVPSGENIRAEISIAYGGAVLAYASVVDNHTGDAICIPAQCSINVGSPTDQIIPVVAKTSGAFGTSWQSDFYLYSKYLIYGEPYKLSYSTFRQEFGSTLVIPPESVFSGRDLVGKLFPTDGAWSIEGSLSYTRYRHTATLLNDGRVLVAGGGGGWNTVEIYDPDTRSWSSANSMITPRSFHTATLLENGKVLVVGGSYSDAGDHFLNSAEIYDPQTGIWSATGNMAIARVAHSATLLLDGKVLVSGGKGYAPYGFSSAEIFDPDKGMWEVTGEMQEGRAYHAAVLMPNGQVLVSGGFSEDGVLPGLASAEFYEPATGFWSTAGSMSYGRAHHTATFLTNGKVLVAGGENDWDAFYSSAELFDPHATKWSVIESMKEARASHAALLMPNGNVIITGGGIGFEKILSSVEEYDCDQGTWKTLPNMSSTRAMHTMTLLSDGRILAAGGLAQNHFALTVETFGPGPEANTSGVLHITNPYASGDQCIVSRTFNQTANGTYGQYVPEGTSKQLLGSYDWEPGQILMAINTDTFRCNVGFSEYSNKETLVNIRLYDDQGDILASTSAPVIVPPYRNAQFSLGDLLGLSASIPAGRIEVEALSGGVVYAYASVVDNRTGDAVFIPATKSGAHPPGETK